ncbi:MAG: YfhO family protein [Anaerolineae bacterium]|nr:YfhO family protein [Anaerolineae bacterium]
MDHNQASLATEKRADLGLVLILALLPCLFFWRLITPSPADRMQIAAGDFTEQYFPLRAFAAQEWVQGRVPLWNPYLYGGQPALADIQSGALYPPHVLQALLLGWGGPLLGYEIGFPLQALTWQVILHFSIAAVGTYGFGRHLARQSGAPLRRARFAGLIASLGFTYSGYLTGFPVQQITILQVSVWLPWVLWGLSVAILNRSPEFGFRLVEAASLRPAAWAALAFALAILAGHPQTVLYIFYLSLTYTLLLGWLISRESASPPPRSPAPLRSLARAFSVWLFAILLGSLLAAAQLWPTLEFIRRSLRADLTYQAVSAGLPLNELIAVLYPGFFGGSPEYVGIASLGLIALALGLGWPRPGGVKPAISGQIIFWLGAALVSLLLAFGGRTFLYSIFYLGIPGFDAVRQQERAFLIYSFSAAVLAGYGALLVSGPLPKPLRWTYLLLEHRLRRVGALALAVTMVYIYGATAATVRGDEVNLFVGVLRHHLFGLLIMAGLLIWLALRSRRWFGRPWMLAVLAGWLAFNLFTVNWRFNLEKPTEPPPFSPNGLTQFLQTNLSHARLASGGLLPGGNSAASVYNLPDLTGNTPLQLAAVERFLREMPSWRLWQLLNVRYVLDTRDIADAGLRLVFEEDGVQVFEMGDPFPPAWLVSHTETVAGDEAALARLAADDFDLRHTAIVAEALPEPLAEASGATVTVTHLTPTHLQAEVQATGWQLLVFSQIDYPGWQATLDGQPVEIRRVNGILQGVLVPAGAHQLDLRFWPVSFWAGSLISGVGLLLWLGLIIIGIKKPR